MTRDETVALYLTCEEKRGEASAAALAEGKSEYEAETIAHEAAKVHWNTWAESLLSERKAMEADGRWAANKNINGGFNPKNAETEAWLEKAATDFSKCAFLVKGVEGTKFAADFPVRFIRFVVATNDAAGEDKAENLQDVTYIKSIELDRENIHFDGFNFPGPAHFEGTAFSGDTDFANATFSANAYFGAATFTGYADFQNATFSYGPDFGRTNFLGFACFDDVTFSGNVSFSNVIFLGEILFERVTFSGNVDFTGDSIFGDIAFSGDATFKHATFIGHADFNGAPFSSKVDFGGATFMSSADFSAAVFNSDAKFAGIKVERAFDMMGAKFAKVPSFTQADFKQAPDLDAVEFPLPTFWSKGESALIPLYRALRRMAIQGSDYEREQMAFKGETRSKRGTQHRLLHPALWFGLAYDALSDFGRSIARPLAIGVVSWLAFAAIYVWNAGVGLTEWSTACTGDGASKALKALTLSAANSLPLIGSSRGEVAGKFYKCLALPDEPAWSPILQITQTLCSAVLIFLFLLALRNQFKIK